MAYAGDRPLHVAIGRNALNVKAYAERSSTSVPYIYYDYAPGVWHLVAVAGGGGGDDVALTETDPANVRAAEAEARAAMDPDGTIPV